MNLIDKAADAIRAAVYESSVVADREHEKAARAAVIAVLEAMREPSAKMADAGYDALCEAYHDGGPASGDIECWQAMIDAALSEDDPGSTPEAPAAHEQTLKVEPHQGDLVDGTKLVMPDGEVRLLTVPVNQYKKWTAAGS